MTSAIRDSDLLRSITIPSLTKYLKAHNWEDQGKWGMRPMSIYACQHEGETRKILVPQTSDVIGYENAISVAIKTLADVQNRPEMDIYRTLQSAGMDEIQIHSTNGLRNKPLSLTLKASLFENSLNIITAAARSADAPSAHHAGPLNATITEFLNRVQPMASASRGYDLLLHSPIPPPLSDQQDLFGNHQQPFARRATESLASALAHTHSAITQINQDHATGQAAFRTGISYGVSSNFCDALSDIIKDGQGAQINIHWATIRPPLSDIKAPTHKTAFQQDAIDILKDASRILRSAPALPRQTLITEVIALNRKDPKQFDGEATLFYRDDIKEMRLRVQFNESDYASIISAYRNNSTVEIIGDIHHRSQGRYNLLNPEIIKIIP